MLKTVAGLIMIVLLLAGVGCAKDKSSTTRPAREKGSASDQHMRQFGLYD